MTTLFLRYEFLLAPIQLVCFMVGMGATLSVGELLLVGRRPRSLLLGTACQFVLAPAVAVAVIQLCELPPGVVVGLVLIAAMPGGSLSKLFVYVGRGNPALSVGLSTFGTLCCLVTVPLLLRLLAARYMPVDFDVPTGLVVKQVALFLVSPLLAGVLIGRRFPRDRARVARWCFRVGTVAVVAMVVGSAGAGRLRVGEYGWQVPVAVLVFCLAAQQLSMVPFRALGWSRADRLSVGLEVTMRNLNLALLLLTIMREVLVARRLADGFAGLDDATERALAGVFWTLLYYACVATGAGFIVAVSFRYTRGRRPPPAAA